VKLTILGCGTSSGVPRIGGDWGSCDPAEPRNARTRASIMVEGGGEAILVDCGPDLRGQLLAAGIGRIDRLFVTHDHADHCHGIDDLRQLMHVLGHPVPLHARQDTIDRLRRRFAYAFDGVAIYRPVVEAVPIAGDDLAFGTLGVRVVDQPHGGITSLGLRFEEAGKSAGYAVDFHDMTDDMRAVYQGLDLMVCDCLRREPHPTHAHLGAVLDWARELSVGRLLLTHLDNSMDYRELAASLPDWAAPAHDGQVVELG
jgi:phosphoribosyl 1,2-cyclic phosphate phosphodiesterase